ncbi:MAG: tRNA (guanosine(46)-N7)-methyltransferase TrmB, partial [Candidatus Aenigmatarchaeota archaeon]
KIHLKTDDTKLFDYSIETVKKEKMEIIEEIRDLYKIEPDPVLNIKTFYEKRHLEEGRKINYLCFSF